MVSEGQVCFFCKEESRKYGGKNFKYHIPLGDTFKEKEHRKTTRCLGILEYLLQSSVSDIPLK